MSDPPVTRSVSDRRPDQDELDALARMSDEEVARRSRDDPEAPPLHDKDWWADADLLPPRKTPVSLRLDPDILAFFKAQGPGYQTRINAILRRYMEAVRGER